MPTSTQTSRGQTTIPQSVRQALNLQPGDRIEFILEGHHVVVCRADADLTSLDGLLDHSDREAVSVEAMHEVVEDADSRDAKMDAKDDA